MASDLVSWFLRRGISYSTCKQVRKCAYSVNTRRSFAVLLSLHFNKFNNSKNTESAFKMCPSTFYVSRTARFPSILATDLQ